MKSHLRAGPNTVQVAVRRQLWVFCAVAVVALIVVSIAAVTAGRSLAREQALKDAERTTTVLADLVVAPLLPGAFDGNPQKRQEFDRVIANRLADGYLTKITIWESSGRVLYDNDADVVGRLLELPDEAGSAIADARVTSDFTDHPEANMSPAESGQAGFVEVYVPLQVPDQPTLAFEAYYDYGRVNSLAGQILKALLPVVLLPLILLQIIHIPMAASLVSRVRRQEAERFRLLELTLSASERERVRLAADLHDGPIQDLAGIGYAFEMWAVSLPTPHPPIVQQLQSAVHRSIESLRRLMIDLYPPDLDAGQLPRTIFDLAEPLRDKGIEVTVTVAALPELDTDTVTALYRIAREALANVAEHSAATQVTINLGRRGAEATGRPAAVYLRIADNGVGLDEATLDRRAEGHLGLLLLMDRVTNLGGSLTLTTGPQGGAVVNAVLPNCNGPSVGARGAATQAHRFLEAHRANQLVDGPHPGR